MTTGRNDPCVCGSGRKYKKCCLVRDDAVRQTLQRIMDLFPDFAAARLAQQRIEHLRLELKGKEKSQAVKLGSYEKDLGLKGPRKN